MNLFNSNSSYFVKIWMYVLFHVSSIALIFTKERERKFLRVEAPSDVLKKCVTQFRHFKNMETIPNQLKRCLQTCGSLSQSYDAIFFFFFIAAIVKRNQRATLIYVKSVFVASIV